MDHAEAARLRTIYTDSPPVLVASGSGPGLNRARRTIDAAGYRLAQVDDLADAPDRMRAQAAASALWLEIDQELSAALLADLASEVRRNRDGRQCGSVIATTLAMVDPVYRAFADSGAEILVDADDAERVAALTIAAGAFKRRPVLHDVTTDNSSVRLRQLSDEVNRIAATLARLSAAPPASVETAFTASGEPPQVAAETVRSIIRARRLRSRFFAEDLFADPAWDMMLDLFQAEISQLRVPVSSLCIAAAVPATTALRWLKAMVDRSLFVRRADPHDGRRVSVELGPDTSKALRHYFAEVERVAVI